MKSIWKGALSFGLVTIRVSLYSAIQEHVIGFKLLCAKCHEPIAYQRWCKRCKKEIAWTDIVKGLKMDDGSYFILTQEKLKELKPATTDTIDITEFVAVSEIKPIYLEQHYYLGPEKGSEKPFFLFKKALEHAKKIAIGSFVMREKQYVCAINPYRDTLLLSTLHYAYEIRDIKEVPDLKAVDAKVIPAEMKLALQLIDQRTVKKFNLEQFKDTFAQQLKEAIKKGKRQKTTPKKKKVVESPGKKEKESSLMTSLRASLQAPGKSTTVAHARRAKAKKSSR